MTNTLKNKIERREKMIPEFNEKMAVLINKSDINVVCSLLSIIGGGTSITRVYATMLSNSQMTPDDVSDETGIPLGTVYKCINRLLTTGLVEIHGYLDEKRKGGPKTRILRVVR